MTTQQSREFVGRVSSSRLRLALSVVAITSAAFILPASSAQRDDSPEITAVVQKFFHAYQQKDLTALMALWNEKSPESAPARQTLEQTFSAVKTIEIKGLDVAKVERTDEKAVMVRVRVEILADDAS